MNHHTVLVVEDNDMNMQLVEYLLEEGGYSIVKATSGEEALAITPDNAAPAPDLILMAIPLPRMGLGAAFDLARQPDVEIVTVADVDVAKARRVAEIVGAKVQPVHLDVAFGVEGVTQQMRGHAAAISCVNYWHNEMLARAAIAA